MGDRDVVSTMEVSGDHNLHSDEYGGDVPTARGEASRKWFPSYSSAISKDLDQPDPSIFLFYFHHLITIFLQY